jgi:hypothetical protein
VGKMKLKLGSEVEEDKEYDMWDLPVLRHIKSLVLERLLVYFI